MEGGSGGLKGRPPALGALSRSWNVAVSCERANESVSKYLLLGRLSRQHVNVINSLKCPEDSDKKGST